MEQDLTNKISRIRSIAVANYGDGEGEPQTGIPPKKPKKPKLNTISEHKKKQAIKGAIVFGLALMLIIAGVFMYNQKREAERLANLKAMKTQQVNNLFAGPLENDTAKFELISKIQAAKTIDELNAINVQQAYLDRLEELKAVEEEKARQEYLAQLNARKEELRSEVKDFFDKVIFSAPLDETLREKAAEEYTTLMSKIDNATTLKELDVINPEVVVADLYREYLASKINTFDSSLVIIEGPNMTKILTKEDALKFIDKISNVTLLTSIVVDEPQTVEFAMTISRTDANGGFLRGGDTVKIYVFDAEQGKYVEVVPMAKVVTALLPVEAGGVNLFESESTTYDKTYESMESTTTTQDSSYATQNDYYSTSSTTSKSASEENSYVTSERYSDASSYSYSTNIAEVLKAIALGKIPADDETMKLIQDYGWRLLDLELYSKILASDPNYPVLVIFEVPAESLPELLTYKDTAIVVKIQGGEGE